MQNKYFTETFIKDLLVFTPEVFEDERGYFFESYNQSIFKHAGLDIEFVQDNQSYSQYGVLRGLHYQQGKHAQSKLVRVIQGEILDVALDLRPNSSTFGKHFKIVLSEQNKQQLFIPKGFAHGFVVLSKTAIFSYKCDNFYNKESESGIRYNDPELSIDWQIPNEDIMINARDNTLPLLASIVEISL